jgi:molecular chaperone GrpE
MENETVDIEKYLRVLADFDNYKKRTSKEMTELVETTKYQTLSDLLDIFDDLELAKTNNNSNDGLDIIYSKIENYIKKQGFEKINSNDIFDENFHECISSVITEDPKKKNHILNTISSGWLLNNKVVRYSKVIVAI